MSFSLPPLELRGKCVVPFRGDMRATSPQPGATSMWWAMTKLDEDMEDLEMWLGEFYEEHGREPYSSHEFFHWYNDRILQLEAKGLEFRDGKIVPKAPGNS